MKLQRDAVLGNSKKALNINRIMKRIKHTMYRMQKFTPKSAAFVLTDQNNVVCLLGR